MMLSMLHIMRYSSNSNLHLLSHDSYCTVTRFLEPCNCSVPQLPQQASNMIHSTKQSTWFVQEQYVFPTVKTFKDCVILISRLIQGTPLSSYCFLPLLCCSINTGKSLLRLSECHVIFKALLFQNNTGRKFLHG